MFAFALFCGTVARAQNTDASPAVAFELEPKQDVYYVGQSVRLKLFIDAGENEIANIDLAGMPDDRFLKKSSFRQIQIKGETRIVLAADTVFMQPGAVVFAPVMSGNVGIRRRTGNFMQTRYQSFRSVANRVTANVREIPLDGRPANFSGAIGNFKLTAELEPRNASPGDLLNLKWRLVGQGTFDDVAPPEYAPGSGFKVYPPKEDARSDNMIAFSHVIIPSGTNVTQAAALGIAVFNPASGAYEMLTSGPFALTITERKTATDRSANLSALKPTVDVKNGNGFGDVAAPKKVRWQNLFGRKSERATMSVTAVARLCPDATSKELFEIPAGATVKIRERAGDYCRVLYDESGGWVGVWTLDVAASK